MKLTYAEQLKHPNWQRRRLEVLEYCGWACSECGNKEKTLHVHHKQYFKGRMAWEYSVDELCALCEACHQEEHHTQDRIKEILCKVSSSEAFALIAGFFGRDCDIDPGVLEEARQIYPLAYAIGFVASLSQLDINKIEEAADFVTKGNKRTRGILDGCRQRVFRNEE